MDEHCVELCDALNALPGIETTQSCEGHGKDSFRVYFDVDRSVSPPEGLFFLARCTSHNYWRYGHLWSIELRSADCGHDELPLYYVLHSGDVVGDEAYRQAASLVANLNSHLNHTGFTRGFNLDLGKFKTEVVSELDV